MAIVDATMTPAEFLLWEEAQDEKHEFLNGNIAVMPGVTWNHSLISSNVLAKIRQMVSGSQCHVVGSDLKVQVPGDGYLYPDVMVVCQPRFSDQKQNALLNPRLIFEILSESTEHRDRTEKFDAYATIPSMDEYFLIASDERRVERFQRRDDGWWLTISRASETVRSDALDFALSLDDIYALVL